MSDMIGSLEAFSVREITKANLPLPVKVELMDISMVPFIEMAAVGPDKLGFWSFDKRKPISGTLWKQGPHSVRFTAEGEPPFTVDFPWSVDAK